MTPQFFIAVSVPIQTTERSCIHVLELSMLHLFFKFWYLIVELFMQCSILNFHVISIMHTRFYFVWCVKMLLQANVSKIGGNIRHVMLNWKIHLYLHTYAKKRTSEIIIIYLWFLPTYRHTLCIAYNQYGCDLFLT